MNIKHVLQMISDQTSTSLALNTNEQRRAWGQRVTEVTWEQAGRNRGLRALCMARPEAVSREPSQAKISRAKPSQPQHEGFGPAWHKGRAEAGRAVAFVSVLRALDSHFAVRSLCTDYVYPSMAETMR
jgi:hypothetical protein